MDFRWTRHAEEELLRRHIPRSLAEQVLQSPQQVVEAPGGLRAYQSRMDFGVGKLYLVRVIVDESSTLPTVITAYRMSKIAKYWRPEP